MTLQKFKFSRSEQGVHRSLPITYISGTGTAGADNTAQTVKTLVLPANTLMTVGDRLRISAYWRGDTGVVITGSVKVGPAASEVLVGDVTDAGGTAIMLTEAWLHYIDNTHANIIEHEPGGLGTLSAANVSGFTWNAAQNILFTQDAAVGNHCVLFALTVDKFLKAT